MAKNDKVEKQMEAMASGPKEKGVIHIAGYEFKTKTVILVVIILGILLAYQTASQHMQKKAEQEQAEKEAAERKAAIEAANNQSGYEVDIDSIIQETLSKDYGIAPEGFKWDFDGTLVSIGEDTGSTAEEITFMYLRSLSILDFATVQYYSQDSKVVQRYTDYYNSDYGLTDYYSDFLRKEYKYALTTMTIDRIGDIAVFADGTEYVTVYVNILDLTNKDFWRVDEQEIYNQLERFKVNDTDETKMHQYLYNYVYESYLNDKVGLRSVEIELVLSKDANGGWYISNDRELDSALSYANGVDVVKYIQDCYEAYYLQKTLDIMEQETNQRIEQDLAE